jgi:hypothetical protein
MANVPAIRTRDAEGTFANVRAKGTLAKYDLSGAAWIWRSLKKTAADIEANVKSVASAVIP